MIRGGRAALAVALLTGCAAVPHATPEDAARAAGSWPGISVADLEAGRSRYVARCTSCHRARSPARYPPDRWGAHLDKMAERARLSPDDRDLILRYLVTLAGRPATP